MTIERIRELAGKVRNASEVMRSPSLWLDDACARAEFWKAVAEWAFICEIPYELMPIECYERDKKEIKQLCAQVRAKESA